MILDHGVGHKHIGADLAAPGDLLLHALDVLDLIQVLALLDLHQLTAQHIHGDLAVLVLAALHLAGHHDAGRQVGQAHGTGGLIDLLPARAAGPVHIHLDVLLADLDIDILVDLRHDLQRGKGGLTAAAGIEGRNTHQAVHAVFGFEEAVGVHSLDEDGGAFDARFVAVEVVQYFIGVAVALRPAGVHAVQHLRPILCLGAAGPRMEGKDGIFAVIFPGEQGGQTHLRHAGLQLLGIGGGFLVHAFIAGLLRQLDKGEGILVQRLQLIVGFHAGFELSGALEHLLAVFHVIPETGLRGLALQLSDLDAQLINVERLF